MNLDEVWIVGRVRRAPKIPVHLASAGVTHGGVFGDSLGVFQLTYRRVVSCDFSIFPGVRRYSLESPTCPTVTWSPSINARWRRMPFRPTQVGGMRPGRFPCWRARMLPVCAYRVAPVRRESRVEMMSTAISAARSPAGWPPSPSTTRKMPCWASMKKRSSFSVRFRPTSEWAPTSNCDVVNMVSLCGARTPTPGSPRWRRIPEETECGARTGWRSKLCLKLQRADIGERDVGRRGQEHLAVTIDLFPAFDSLHTIGNGCPVHRGSELTEIPDEEGCLLFDRAECGSVRGKYPQDLRASDPPRRLFRRVQ